MDAETSIYDALEHHLGWAGRMLSGTKTARRGHKVYWNACVFTEDGVQVWYGDIDLTDESERLQAIANEAGQVILVTPEQPFRWDGLKVAKHDRERIVRFEPDGS